LGYLKNGDIVVLQEVDGAWGRIRFQGQQGWVSLAYLQYVPTRVTVTTPIYTITLKLGESVLERMTVDKGGALTLPPLPIRSSPDPTKFYFEAVGWDSDGDLKADLFPNDTHQLWADTALQAIYQKQQVLYTVRFYGADGVLIEEKQYPYNATLTPPDMAAHAPEDGRIFDGWDSMLLTVTEDIDYHAVYLPAPEPVRYTIRFLHRDGTLLLEQQLLEGEMPRPPNGDPRLAIDDGSVFLGWDSDIVPATADAEYRAVYEMPPDDPDPEPEPEPEPDPEPTPAPEDDAPTAIIVIFVLLGVLLLGGAVVLVIRTADKSRNIDDTDDWA
jgi:hypothetical protein